MDSVDLNVLRSVLEWRRAGQRVVLFTVVQTWGTAPRPPGAMPVSYTHLTLPTKRIV